MNEGTFSSGFHQSVQTHLKVGPKNVEVLARAVLTQPHHQPLLNRHFPKTKNLYETMPPPKPRDLLFHPPF